MMVWMLVGMHGDRIVMMGMMKMPCTLLATLMRMPSPAIETCYCMS